MINDLITNPIILAFLATVSYVVTGFLKDPSNEWDSYKAIFSFLIAIVSGGVAVFYNLSPADAFTFATTSGFITVVLENITKAIIRRLFPNNGVV